MDNEQDEITKTKKALASIHMYYVIQIQDLVILYIFY